MVGQVGATLRENSALVEKQPYVAHADVMRPLPRLDQPSSSPAPRYPAHKKGRLNRFAHEALVDAAILCGATHYGAHALDAG
jgi:hypothetical protein